MMQVVIYKMMSLSNYNIKTFCRKKKINIKTFYKERYYLTLWERRYLQADIHYKIISRYICTVNYSDIIVPICTRHGRKKNTSFFELK